MGRGERSDAICPIPPRQSLLAAMSVRTGRPQTYACHRTRRALRSFTRSSIAPTLLGRKMENCLTSGPPILEVVSGESRAIKTRLSGPVICRCEGREGKSIVGAGAASPARELFRSGRRSPWPFFTSRCHDGNPVIGAPQASEAPAFEATARKQADPAPAQSSGLLTPRPGLFSTCV